MPPAPPAPAAPPPEMCPTLPAPAAPPPNSGPLTPDPGPRSPDPGPRGPDPRRLTETTGQISYTQPHRPRNIAVTILRHGKSTNGYTWPGDVLANALPLFHGATAFCDHNRQQRSVRDVVGSYHDVRQQEGNITGVLRLLDEPIARLVEAIIADRAAGIETPNVGLSVDVSAELAPDRTVTRILAVNSVDIVFDPSAGGSFDRLLESVAARRACPQSVAARRACPESVVARRACPESVVARRACLESVVARSACPHSVAARRACLESVVARSACPQEMNPMPDPLPPTPPAPSIPTPGPLNPLDCPASPGVLSSQPWGAVQGGQADPGSLTPDPGPLALQLSASGLPEPARRRIAAQFSGRIYEAAELSTAISEMRALVGDLTGQSAIHNPGIDRIQVGMGKRDRLQAATDLLFGNDLPETVRCSLPRTPSIRELFTAAGFDGRLGWESRRVMEANEVTTSVMANIVGTSVNKRLIKDYAGQPKWWKPIVVEVPLKDMKAQPRIRLNDFAALTEIATENTAYANLAWDDAAETYTPVKHGNLVYITLETIINDDVRAVQSIPKKLARAAAITLNEHISALFTANSGAGAALADTYYVFDASNHQSNLGSAALDATSLQAAMVAISKMSDTASKRLGLTGKYLLVPPDLQYTAHTLAYSQLQPGTPNNDANALQGRIEPIVVPQFTDTNNWYLLAPPSMVELIEVGYLDGQDTPELFVQDDPTAGTVFTHDAISYKIRWIFGCGWLDYRGAYGAVVT